VGVHLTHPRADSSSTYVIGPLVAAGCAVLARYSRSPNNDTMVVQEQLLLDSRRGSPSCARPDATTSFCSASATAHRSRRFTKPIGCAKCLLETFSI
jgi:hypothetical protein